MLYCEVEHNTAAWPSGQGHLFYTQAIVGSNPTVATMNVDEQRLFSSTVFALTSYIWDIVVRARQGFAAPTDFQRGDLFAANLNLLLDWYTETDLRFLPETTMWLAHEVIVTLSDIEVSHG